MKRILVIEDEPQMLLGLRDNLELEGYEVQTAGDGDEGLTQGGSFNPDLVILDVMLPKKNGFDVCRELRAPLGVAADRHAHRAIGGDRQGAGPRARRRRLRHQTVLDHRAACTGPRGAAARRHAEATRCRRPRAHRRHRSRLQAASGAPRQGCASSSRRANSTCSATSSSTPARSSPASRFSTRCGATRSSRRRARSTTSSPSCGRRSSGRRTRRSTFSPSTARAINLSGNTVDLASMSNPDASGPPQFLARLGALCRRHRPERSSRRCAGAAAAAQAGRRRKSRRRSPRIRSTRARSQATARSWSTKTVASTASARSAVTTCTRKAACGCAKTAVIATSSSSTQVAGFRF